jgi:hypothetical protein
VSFVRKTSNASGIFGDEGKASGPAKPLDFDELRQEAQKRLAEAKKA